MKKIYSILLILIAGTIISFNNSSSDDSQTGYVDPGFDDPTKIPIPTTYNIGGISTTSTSKAVICQGSVGGKSQVGIAVDNGSGVNLKIYWEGTISTSAVGTYSPTQYTIKVISGGTPYTSTDPLNIVITPNNPTDGIYNIQFLSNISVGPVTINSSTSYINAYKY